MPMRLGVDKPPLPLQIDQPTQKCHMYKKSTSQYIRHTSCLIKCKRHLGPLMRQKQDPPGKFFVGTPENILVRLVPSEELLLQDTFIPFRGTIYYKGNFFHEVVPSEEDYAYVL